MSRPWKATDPNYAGNGWLYGTKPGWAWQYHCVLIGNRDVEATVHAPAEQKIPHGARKRLRTKCTQWRNRLWGKPQSQQSFFGAKRRSR